MSMTSLHWQSGCVGTATRLTGNFPLIIMITFAGRVPHTLWKLGFLLATLSYSVYSDNYIPGGMYWHIKNNKNYICTSVMNSAHM
jgi:hypothetical protein